jgi:predicted O-methyltransferase YrrM
MKADGRILGEIVPHELEEYMRSLARPAPPGFDNIREEGLRLNLPIIDPRVGTLLFVLVRTAGARRVLEIGTANGYSGAWIANAMQSDGCLITVELDASRAELAKNNFETLGLNARVQQIVGNATEVVNQVCGPFDLIFNDGGKLEQEAIHDRLVALLRVGGLLVTDNALWSGEVVPGFHRTPLRPVQETHAVAAYNQQLVSDTRLLTSIVPLRDGVALSVKL